jgi:nitrile hydratase subunit beta
MTHPHDIGAATGYGAIDTALDTQPFHHEWEARVFALNRVLLGKGVYTLDEFRDAIERMAPQAYHDSMYYERWLHAIEALLERKGVLHV